MRGFLILLALLMAGPALSQEGSPREPESNTDRATQEQPAGDQFQSQRNPFPSWISPQAIPPIINVYSAKHAGEESHCASPKDWKEWPSYAWCRSVEWADPERVIAIWTVILGLATGILGLATRRLWKATEQLVLGSEKTAERQLKAYVDIAAMDAGFAPAVHGQQQPVNAAFRITFKNFGATPAYNLRLQARTVIRETPLGQEPLPDPTRMPLSFQRLPPGAQLSPNIPAEEGTATPTEIAEWQMNRAEIYCYGSIIFEDEFKTETTIHFRLAHSVFDRGSCRYASDGNSVSYRRVAD